MTTPSTRGTDLQAELDRAQRRVDELERELARQQSSDEQVRASEEKYRTLVESSPYCIKLIDGEGCLLSMNQSGLEMINEARESDIIGRHYMKVVSDRDYDRVAAHLERALAGEASEFEFLAAQGRFFRSNLVPIKPERGSVTRLLSITQDITDSRRLVDELDHRVKNNLAAVLALCEQTRSATKTTDHFAQTFDGRIRAMARSHEAMAESRWEGVDLHDLVRLALDAHVDGTDQRVQIIGAHGILPPQTCGPLMLALHELTTNAVKYGAFATPDGRLEFESRVDADGRLQLHWVEISPRENVSPLEAGVGLALVRGFIEHELNGTLDLDLRETGLVARLSIPLDAFEARTDRAVRGWPRSAPKPPSDESTHDGLRVLVVEDNFLAAMSLMSMLEGAGCTVVGPLATLGEDDLVTIDGSFDVAFLDINLVGGTSYSIAEALIERGCPVVFVTGYDSPCTLPPALMQVPTLRKPIDVDAVRSALSQVVGAQAAG